jgi:2-oxoglutarate ferredoxin oxidoreductase subunit alpha
MAQAATVAIVGSGGDGVILLGELLAATAASAGLHCFLTKSFGPQIRGGETSCLLTVSEQPLHCPAEQADLLAVLDWQALAHFRGELRWRNSAVAFSDDKHEPVADAFQSNPTELHALHLEHLAMEQAGTKLARNMVLGGAICAALGWPVDALAEQVSLRLARRGEDELRRNLAALQAGYGLAVKQVDAPTLPAGAIPLLLETGNQAIVRGAIAAGCRYFAGYPISPATEIMEQLITELPAHGGVAVQAEDEIAAIGMALGAAAGGVRAMTATSGPGFSLMAETLGLAVVTELPLVVVDVQRVGPSTGIPSRTEQADLNMALYGRHGDAPLPVLAPVSITDCGEVAQAAFRIAEEYRTPVVVLSDQFLAQSIQSGTLGAVAPIVGSVAIASSARSLTGLVHDETGEPSAEPWVHARNACLRGEKMERLRAAMTLAPARYSSAGPAGSGTIGLLSWGSSFGPACVAADILGEQGYRGDVLALRQLYPLQHELISQWLKGLSRVLLVELNFSGQFQHYIHSQFDFHGLPVRGCNRAGGTPLMGEEIAANALEFIGAV